MGKIHAIALIELAVIALVLLAYPFHLFSASSIQENQSPFKEPPALTVETNTTQEITNDLQSLGVKIFHIKSGFEYAYSDQFVLDSYPEFRTIAYNSGYVTLWERYSGVFFTSYDSRLFTYYPA